MTTPIGFIVNGLVAGDGLVHVLGRCGDEFIAVGDAFETIYLPRGESAPAQDLGIARPVRLRVERVQAYQRELPQLSGGMTGTIDLRGEGLDLLVPGGVLGAVVHHASDASQTGHITHPSQPRPAT
jgi:hypothetical protein